MIISNCEQRSDEWFDLRRGIPTASEASKILTPTGKLSTQSAKFINQLIADSLGLGDPPFEITEHMQRGIDKEPEARRFFEFETDQKVIECGFITNDDKTAGCSPDGLIPFSPELETQYRSGLEIKVPKASTHIGYLLGQKLPDFYKCQVHYSMAVSGLKHWWFMSYNEELEPLIIEVEWDEYTDAIEQAMHEFTINLNTARQTLKL